MVIRKICENDIESIVKLINELSTDLKEIFIVDKVLLMNHFAYMKKYPDIYYNFVLK